MTTLRPFRPQDLFEMSLTNLDPLTENYDMDFYLEYLTKWPSLFTVAEDQDGNIIGYSERSNPQNMFCLLGLLPFVFLVFLVLLVFALLLHVVCSLLTTTLQA